MPDLWLKLNIYFATIIDRDDHFVVKICGRVPLKSWLTMVGSWRVIALMGARVSCKENILKNDAKHGKHWLSSEGIFCDNTNMHWVVWVEIVE